MKKRKRQFCVACGCEITPDESNYRCEECSIKYYAPYYQKFNRNSGNRRVMPTVPEY